MNRTTSYALLACLPVGGLLALVANGNRAAEMITAVAVGTTAASVGWYGPRMALELRQDTIMRGRHRRASTMATRPRTAAAEPYRGQDEDDLGRTGEQPALPEQLPPSQRQHAEQAGAEQLPDDSERTLPPSARYPDPYLYRPDDEPTHVVDVPAARDELAERGVWYTSTGTAQSYTLPSSTAAAEGEDLYARGPWAPAASS